MATQLIIDNQYVQASSGATFDRQDPVTGKVVTTAAAGTVEDALRAADSAARAFKTWSKTGPIERRTLLCRAADALESRTAQFVAVMAQEVGAGQVWSSINVALAAALFREACGRPGHTNSG
jgi:salicylaldehyde dehydrogenase